MKRCCILNEQDYLILVTIYNERNITKAAEKLYVSQPTLTYRLNQIEQKLDGIQIIYKHERKLMFTTEGEYIVQFAKKALNDLYQLKTTMHNIKNTNVGSIYIGASSNFSIYKLPKIIKDFF